MRKRPASATDLAESQQVGKRPAAHANGALAGAPCTAPGGEEPARILRGPTAHSDAQLSSLGAALRSGRLVAFPTETVYGLGANGLDAAAVLKIFEAKGRPLNDPCILHVPGVEEGLRLLDLSALEQAVFKALTAAAWPGPLSVVGRARPSVPREVTAQTDFVAVRCPDHPLALRLLRAAAVPVAAPSANRFGHISPTCADHVFEDLNHVSGLQILDGGSCGVGIESTVVKLDLENRRVLVLRKGGTTREQLEAALAKGAAEGLFNGAQVIVEYHRPHATTASSSNSNGSCVAQTAASAAEASDSTPAVATPSFAKQADIHKSIAPDENRDAEHETEPQQAPGMMLRHYAPSVPTYLLSQCAISPEAGGSAPSHLGSPARSVLIDFSGRLRQHQALFLRCFDLCGAVANAAVACTAEGAEAEEACRRVFAVLREAEAFAQASGAEVICLADFETGGLQGSFAEALHDRLFRAASGRSAALRLPADGGAGEAAQLVAA